MWLLPCAIWTPWATAPQLGTLPSLFRAKNVCLKMFFSISRVSLVSWLCDEETGEQHGSRQEHCSLKPKLFLKSVKGFLSWSCKSAHLDLMMVSYRTAARHYLLPIFIPKPKQLWYVFPWNAQETKVLTVFCILLSLPQHLQSSWFYNVCMRDLDHII